MQLTAGKPDPIALERGAKSADRCAGSCRRGRRRDQRRWRGRAAGGEAARQVRGGCRNGRPRPAQTRRGARRGAVAAGGSEAARRANAPPSRIPYAILARLAEKYTLDHPTTVDTIVGDDRPPGIASGEVDRDPFDPVYWQIQPLPPAQSGQRWRRGDRPGRAADALPDVQATVPPTVPRRHGACRFRRTRPRSSQRQR